MRALTTQRTRTKMIDIKGHGVCKAVVERLQLLHPLDSFETQFLWNGKGASSIVGGLDRFVVRPCFRVGFRTEEDPFALAVFFPTIYNPFRC